MEPRSIRNTHSRQRSRMLRAVLACRPGRALLIVGTVVSLGVSTLAGVTGAQGASNPIVVENQRAGTDAWLIPNDGFLQADDTNNQIKGYASAPSVNKGGRLTFYVTVNPAQTFTIDIYRMGWYGGLGGRLLRHVGPLTGISQPACPTVDSATMLIACSWTPSHTLAVPTNWTDGVYLAVLSSNQQYQNYVPFVVRDDARQAALLYQQPVNTYQAYNAWGGKSLYAYNSTGNARAYKVSFDRPFGDDGSADYFGWEVYLVQWLEQQGYDVTYNTDADADSNPSRLRSAKGVLVAGHGEYWSKGMYDAAQAARDAGVSLAFMGSNTVYWQVRYESSGAGVARRVLVCYKPPEPPNPVDPITATQPSLTTTQWRLSPVNRPEQTLIGVQFTSQTGNDWDATVPYVVTNSGNSVYAGTGFQDGSQVPRITGYEADRLWQEYPDPTSQGAVTLLSNSPYTNVNGASDFQNTSLYKAMSGAWVFGSGTESWSWAMSRPDFVNAGLQQTTTNLLTMMINNVPVPATPTPTPTPLQSPYRSAILTDHPVAYWRLGESTGRTAADQLGLHNGTYAYGPSLGASGALTGDPNTAVGFNGTNQFATVLTDASLNTPTFSVELWAYPTGGDGAYRGVAASRFYPTGWSLYLGAGGGWEFWINSGTGMISMSGGAGSLNTWHHVVATFDGTTATLYVNGTAVASGAVSAAYQPQSQYPLEIAQSEPGGNFYFPGRIDEPALYSSALTSGQVQTHYSIGTTGH
jgi:Concanavalin A-like lectin/glucanases superfamily